jgi:DnaJ-class molecular chaperone
MTIDDVRKRSAKSGTVPSGSSNLGRSLNPGDEALPGTPGTGEDVCPQCHGKGRVDGLRCENCGGSGKIVEAIGGA